MADATEQTTNEQPKAEESKDDLVPRHEAKKAFEARDKAKEEARKLKEKLEALESAEADRAAKVEEDRLKQAGQWDAMKQSLVTKHSTELESERKERLKLEAEYRQEKIEAAFLGASDLFGGDSARTIFTGDMAHAYLGKYVSYEDIDTNGISRKAIVVRDTDGNVIVDGKGNPAKFADAISEVIASLPNRDRILRGSGKTGSGSSGGAIAGGKAIDLDRLTSDQFKDPKVREALKERHANAGGLVMGRAWERKA